jgi:hypothetical protein
VSATTESGYGSLIESINKLTQKVDELEKRIAQLNDDSKTECISVLQESGADHV